MKQICWSVEQAGAALGLGRTTLYRLIASGELQTVKIGRRRLVPAEAAKELLRARLQADGNERQ